MYLNNSRHKKIVPLNKEKLGEEPAITSLVVTPTFTKAVRKQITEEILIDEEYADEIKIPDNLAAVLPEKSEMSSIPSNCWAELVNESQSPNKQLVNAKLTR